MHGTRIGLDSPAFAGRLRTNGLDYSRRPTLLKPRLISDVRVSGTKRNITAKTQSSIGTQAKKVLDIRRAGPKSLPTRQKHSEVLKRQIVTKPKIRRRRRPLGMRKYVLSALAVILFVSGMGLGVLQLNTNHKVEAQVKTLSAKTQSQDPDSSDIPSEAPAAGSLTSYKTAPSLPRIISIPKNQVEARVLRLGVKSNNEIMSPANINDAGWYEGSAKPGERGAVLLVGHVHGPSKPGVFYGLKKLRPGDKISIERGDGQKFNYKVVKLQSYDKDNVDMGAALSSVQPDQPGLNLITCDGDYDTEGNYSKRLVVFAVLDT